MKVVAIVLAALCLLSGAYVVAAQVAAAQRAPTALEQSLGSGGLRVERAVASPLPVLERPSGAPEVVVLAGAGAIPAAERAGLASFVKSGGEVWVVGSSPQPAQLGAGDAWALQVLAGQIVASDTAAPALATASGAKVHVEGALALGAAGSAFSPYLRAPLESFRDSNGDGRLNEGEPSGPFLAGVTAKLGQGRLVFLPSDSPAGVLTPDLVGDLLKGRQGVRALVVDHSAIAAWQVPAATLLEEAATLGQPWIGVALLALGVAASLGLVLARVAASKEEDKAALLIQRLAYPDASPDEPGDSSS